MRERKSDHVTKHTVQGECGVGGGGGGAGGVWAGHTRTPQGAREDKRLRREGRTRYHTGEGERKEESIFYGYCLW